MILVCGEALFDMMGVATPDGEAFLPVVGGSPLNVAIGIARLGRPAAFLSKLSTDFFGDRLDAVLAAEGVDRRFVRRAAGRPTTLAFVALGADGQPVYAFHGAGAADRSMTPDDLPGALPAAVTAIHVGSIALAQEPTASTLERLVAREAAHRVISLDPNIRPSVIPDRAGHVARVERLFGHADLVKASAEDAAWLAGGTVDPAETARDWSRRGPALVCVTDGANGLIVARDGYCEAVTAPAVAVADTIGAGDTVQAALLARLDETGRLDKAALRRLGPADLRDLAGFAAAAAAITVTRRGADLPRRAELAEAGFPVGRSA